MRLGVEVEVRPLADAVRGIDRDPPRQRGGRAVQLLVDEVARAARSPGRAAAPSTKMSSQRPVGRPSSAGVDPDRRARRRRRRPESPGRRSRPAGSSERVLRVDGPTGRRRGRAARRSRRRRSPTAASTSRPRGPRRAAAPRRPQPGGEQDRAGDDDPVPVDGERAQAQGDGIDHAADDTPRAGSRRAAGEPGLPHSSRSS